MNWNIIKVVLGREYTSRVKKKSFLLITFLGPILFAAICLVPSLIMYATKEASKTVAVVDASGIVMPALTSGDSVTYLDCSSESVDALKEGMKDKGYDAVLYVSPIDSASRAVSVTSWSSKPLGMDLVSSIESGVNDAVENWRIASYDIENLGQIMSDVKSHIRITPYTLSEEGKETLSVSEIYMIISMLLGMIIYMFIAMFCSMVMTSVIEEKSSRVVEVLVSSVKSTELMFGKIVGVALVALTQFFLWIVLTLVIVAGVGGIIGMDKLAGGAQADPTAQIIQSAGVSSTDIDALPIDVEALTAPADSTQAVNGLAGAISTLKGINYTQILISFLIYFVFGYLLYASLFAAIGSAVENEADTQQLQIPVTVPLLIGFFIALYAFKSPDSSLVFWGSMIPFTSPIVMLARIPFGVPFWQLALSVVLLILTFVAMAWVSAKIYRVGILMFGKKSSFKDLWNWLKQK